MASDPSIRASDQDRDRTARLLREHHAAGRLDPEEFNERLDKVYETKTIADLDQLTADLPAIDLYPLPDASLPRDRVVRTGLPASYVGTGAEADPVGSALAKLSSGTGRFSPGWIAAWGGWSALVIICLVIAILGGSAWPLLGAGVLGAIMGVRWAAGPGILGRRGPQGHLDSRPPDQLPGSGDS
jgi:Domain of unknown function (DUF1707)